jgi:hypothetical protein
MKRALVFTGIALSGLALYGWQCGSPPAEEGAAGRQVELTVYSQDFAQVSEVRPVELLDGVVRIVIGDVSHRLDDSTVQYGWPDGSGAEVTEATYDLGTSTGQTLLEQLVGRTVTLVYRSDTGRATDRETGVLEVASPGNVVVRVGDRLVINPDATIEAPAGAVATMPKLTAAVQNGSKEEVDMSVSYMTRGLSWGADYVMTLGDEGAGLELWAKVTNQTGIDFPAAKIKFVAGAPNRAVVDTLARKKEYDYAGELGVARKAPAMYGMAGADAAAIAPVPMGELIAYPYESKATLKNNQTNRVLMLREPKVSVVRDYAIRLPSPGWYGYHDASQQLKATLSLAFKNSDESGLGQPLPAGEVRVYEPTKSGAPEYVGAASIRNTPKDDRIDLTLTEVFNVTARAKLVESRKLDKRKTAYTYEVTASNQKARPVDVRLVASFYGTWAVTDETVKSTRPDAATAQWILSVPSGGEAKLKYTVVLG